MMNLHRRSGRSVLLLAITFPLAGCATAVVPVTRVIPVGQEKQGPWWMSETAMSVPTATQPAAGHGSRIDLRQKDWFARAAALKVGEQFTLGEPARMLVRREKIVRRTGSVEGLVWVIDDDEDGSVAAGGDVHADCYVVDYGADGIVDRMVDYIDTDGDRLPEEMDIRYFDDGELRSVWCGLDLDGDGKMWDLKGYEYSADFFASDPYGDNMIYMQKYDPARGEWAPVSECPFAFYDTDGDAESEVAVRVSAVPCDYSTSTDADYANDARRYRGPWSEDMRRMCAVNIRYSFDIDDGSTAERPLHYDFGFNMVGNLPYAFEGMQRFQPLRRPPQVTRVTPFDGLRGICDRYPARETGFSWREHADDTISIGHPSAPQDDWRWEGVFWIWERRFMGNTGGPTQRWNMRREWTDRPASSRELYYSEVDRRIHLYGAKEGWIQVGHFAGLGALGEIRMFDTDGNGYFDRWEAYTTENPVPVRVVTVRDERARRLPFDQAELTRFYTQELLPAALEANRRLSESMSAVMAPEVPPKLKAAMEQGSMTERRYAGDLAVGQQYQQLRRAVSERAGRVLAEARHDDLRPLPREKRETTYNTQTAWQALRLLERLDVATGQGDVDAACAALAEMKRLREAVK